MSQWSSTKARKVLTALEKIGWCVKRQTGSLEEEFRSQNSGVRIKTLSARRSVNESASVLKTTKFPIWWGCKNADYSDARGLANAALSASRTEFILTSDF